jgi:hypothetical protein
VDSQVVEEVQEEEGPVAAGSAHKLPLCQNGSEPNV